MKTPFVSHHQDILFFPPALVEKIINTLGRLEHGFPLWIGIGELPLVGQKVPAAPVQPFIDAVILLRQAGVSFHAKAQPVRRGLGCLTRPEHRR